MGILWKQVKVRLGALAIGGKAVTVHDAQWIESHLVAYRESEHVPYKVLHGNYVHSLRNDGTTLVIYAPHVHSLQWYDMRWGPFVWDTVHLMQELSGDWTLDRRWETPAGERHITSSSSTLLGVLLRYAAARLRMNRRWK